MNNKSCQPIQNERAQHLLKEVVERYIKDGQPVGSKTLAEAANISLSPATIRNVLAELEEQGYLSSPHTSAGRIPTVQGYRFFVNALLTTESLQNPCLKQVEQCFSPDLEVSDLVSSASNLLSDLTKLVGVVTLPKREAVTIRHIEFVSLGENRILAILVLNQDEVQNRILYPDRTYSAAELQQAANFLNASYSGKDILQARKELQNSVQSDRNQLDQLMQMAIKIVDKILDHSAPKNDYIVAGQNHIFDLAETTNLTHARQLFSAFSQKQDILHLLDQCLHTDGIQIFIGEESGYDLFDNCSLITASYSVQDKVVGALGVIGPTRMSYDKVIPIVNVTAKLLSSALNPAK